MSYWISLRNPDDEQPLILAVAHSEGGTYALGGTDEAVLNVTYNYARFFNFRALDSKTGEASIPLLEAAVEELGTERDENYWASTSGSAGYACSILLKWAREHPEGIWHVS